MTRLPGFEFAACIIPAGLSQFTHYAWIAGRQPILKFIQRVHGFQHLDRNSNNRRFFFHGHTLDLPEELARFTPRCIGFSDLLRDKSHCAAECIWFFAASYWSPSSRVPSGFTTRA